MKKIILFLAGMMTLSVSSCSDMLDVESDRGLIEPEINQTTDSLFYAFGIMKAMQQAADQYVLQNELRGELLQPAKNSDKNLVELSEYRATTANKYDSAYVYYNVINQCNYYLAHRDTAIYDGSFNVTTAEYAGVMAFRAWAYLQAARVYGKVPFFTHPLTTISQIENFDGPTYGIKEIVDSLDNGLLRYKGQAVPGHAYGKNFIPVDVILGEMYLEAGRYSEAANSYYTYLFNTKRVAPTLGVGAAAYFTKRTAFGSGNVGQQTDNQKMWTMPTDVQVSFSNSWYNSFDGTSTSAFANSNQITVIDMAATIKDGTVSRLPVIFGSNIYTTSREYDSLYVKPQVEETARYKELADTLDFYYTSTAALTKTLKYAKLGDMRANYRREWMKRTDDADYIPYQAVFSSGAKSRDIVLYKTSTIWLHLAEALNRMGYPDAAFAILKDGITDKLLNSQNAPYITEKTRQLLTTTLPFCSFDGTSEQSQVFSNGENPNVGIHSYGCADDATSIGGASAYQMDTIVGLKLAYIERIHGVESTETLADTINAVEDLICDEYALECAFEGHRFADLTRMARHKNEAGLYGGNFGGLWFKEKMSLKNVAKDLSIESNWYLPFK